MSTPGATWGQAWVVIVPVVMVIVGADQMAVGGLLVVRDQMFVREPLEGQTQRACYRSEQGIHTAAAGGRSCHRGRV